VTDDGESDEAEPKKEKVLHTRVPAVLEQELVGLFDVVTHPEARRAGHATELVDGLLGWARDNGARRAYLQMVAANDAARALYDRLGFEPLYHYWYRISN